MVSRRRRNEPMSDEETWLEALATHERLATGRRKVELISSIRPSLERPQREARTMEELRASYQASDEWWPQIVRTGYPDQPRPREEHRTADAIGDEWVRCGSGPEGRFHGISL
jgi:hypothetical protein